MTRWWWVRHGPTHEKTFVGWRDVPADLTDLAALARLNAHLPKDAVLLSSDLVRASATAAALGRGPAATHVAIREFDFGDWDGQHFSAVAESHPDLSRKFWEEPGDLAPPNGESWNAVAARVNAFVSAKSAQHPNRDIIAVAHFGVILTQVQLALGCTPYAALGYPIDNLSVTDMTFANGTWSIGRINHIL